MTFSRNIVGKNGMYLAKEYAAWVQSVVVEGIDEVVECEWRYLKRLPGGS